MEAAEFLLYRGQHFSRVPGGYEKARSNIQADALLPAEEISKRLVRLEAIRQHCHEEGDIFQVHPGGTMYDEERRQWREKCTNPHAYMLRVEGMSFEESKKYEQADQDETTPSLLRHRRRYQVEIPKLDIAVQRALEATKQAVISKPEFLGCMKDKKSEITPIEE